MNPIVNFNLSRSCVEKGGGSAESFLSLLGGSGGTAKFFFLCPPTIPAIVVFLHPIVVRAIRSISTRKKPSLLPIPIVVGCFEFIWTSGSFTDRSWLWISKLGGIPHQNTALVSRYNDPVKASNPFAHGWVIQLYVYCLKRESLISKQMRLLWKPHRLLIRTCQGRQWTFAKSFPALNDCAYGMHSPEHCFHARLIMTPSPLPRIMTLYLSIT